MNINYKPHAVSFALFSLFAWGTPFATPVTYDFTGTVTSASGIFSSVQGAVSGTYTIDVGAAIASQSSAVSTTQEWGLGASGGPIFAPAPLPTAVVFSSTLNGAGGFSYTTAPIGTATGDSVQSEVAGIACTPLAPLYNPDSCRPVGYGSPNAYEGSEIHDYNSGAYIGSGLALIAPPPGTSLPYTSRAPVVPPGASRLRRSDL